MLCAVNSAHLAFLVDLHGRTRYISFAYVCVLRPLEAVKEVGSQRLVKIHLQARYNRRKHHLRVTKASVKENGYQMKLLRYSEMRSTVLCWGVAMNMLLELLQYFCDSGTSR